MKGRAGFTLIELLIVITIMGILLGIAVINLSSNQVSARDEKRKSDVATIAQQLENYYNTGSNPSSTYNPGEYPPTDYMNTEAGVKAALRDMDPKALRGPNVSDSSSISLVVATTNTAQTPTISTYIYQPLAADGSLCQHAAQECRKFILYYMLEATSGTQQIVSKNQ